VVYLIWFRGETFDAWPTVKIVRLRKIELCGQSDGGDGEAVSEKRLRCEVALGWFGRAGAVFLDKLGCREAGRLVAREGVSGTDPLRASAGFAECFVVLSFHGRSTGGCAQALLCGRAAAGGSGIEVTRAFYRMVYLGGFGTLEVRSPCANIALERGRCLSAGFAERRVSSAVWTACRWR